MIETSIARHWFMHTPHAVIGMGGNIKRQKGDAPPLPSPETRTLHVSVLAGLESMWETAAERVVAYLNRDLRLCAEREWASAASCEGPAEDYDCLVLLGWPAINDRRRLKQIELYCRGGGPLVALRTLHAELPGWPDFAEEVFGGRQPPSPQTRLLEAQRSNVAWHHPILDGMTTLIAEGEIYRGPRLSSLATVLLNADDTSGPQAGSPAPVAWTMRYGGGRVFCTTLGQEDDFRDEAFLRLIVNAVQWTTAARRTT